MGALHLFHTELKSVLKQPQIWNKIAGRFSEADLRQVNCFDDLDTGTVEVAGICPLGEGLICREEQSQVIVKGRNLSDSSCWTGEECPIT